MKGYVIDTSAWIDLDAVYDRAVFPTIWKTFEDASKDARLCSPKEVYAEIDKSNKALFGWVKARKSDIIAAYDEKTLRCVGDIQTQCANLVDWDSTIPEADPFVIAMAHSRNFAVVSNERKTAGKPPQVKWKIPSVCEQFSVPHFRLLEFFRHLQLKL